MRMGPWGHLHLVNRNKAVNKGGKTEGEQSESWEGEEGDRRELCPRSQRRKEWQGEGGQ